MADFQEAVDAGMAVRVPLDAQTARNIGDLIVLGVRDTTRRPRPSWPASSRPTASRRDWRSSPRGRRPTPPRRLTPGTPTLPPTSTPTWPASSPSPRRRAAARRPGRARHRPRRRRPGPRPRARRRDRVRRRRARRRPGRGARGRHEPRAVAGDLGDFLAHCWRRAATPIVDGEDLDWLRAWFRDWVRGGGPSSRVPGRRASLRGAPGDRAARWAAPSDDPHRPPRSGLLDVC